MASEAISTASKAGDESDGPSLLEYRDTDSGNAERLAAKYGEKILYRKDGECWHIYDPESGVWEEVHRDELKALGRETIRSFQEQLKNVNYSATQRKNFARTSENTAKLNNLVREAKTLPSLRITSERFDRDPCLLNTENGVVDLEAGQLREHRPQDLFTRVTEANYNEGGSATLWQKFLRTIFDGDEALIDYVQRAVGYALSGLQAEQGMFILKGDGANGKSTFLEVIREVLGEYAANTPVSTLLPGSRDGHDADLARLPNVRFLTISELERGEKFVESRLKRLTGEDVMTVRDIYEGYFEYTPDFTLFMATNHWPEVSVDDYAVRRRLNVIPFPVRIPRDRRDSQLKRKLSEEGDGILSWAVEGFQKWQERTLENEPQAVVQAKKEWQNTLDRRVSSFIEKCLRRAPGEEVRTKKVHEAYKSYCLEDGIEPLRHQTLNKRLERHFDGAIYKDRKGGGMHWFGLELVESR